MSVHPRRLQWFFLTKVMYIFVVSIHAPTKGATKFLLESVTLIRVSIHASTKGATVLSSYGAIHSGVSIHAPTKGATVCYQDSQCVQKVSIHAPTKGATLSPSGRYNFPCGFNPRTHEGCDIIRTRDKTYSVVSPTT